MGSTETKESESESSKCTKTDCTNNSNVQHLTISNVLDEEEELEEILDDEINKNSNISIKDDEVIKIEESEKASTPNPKSTKFIKFSDEDSDFQIPQRTISKS